jgi:teichuronic acid biosynthesis glycosyltransferase TuaG
MLRIKTGNFVHIIMPVYNTPGALLQSSIISIINQSYQDWKLWIIDDGSTNEETKAVLKAYEKEPQIDIRLKWNEGVSSARNFALEIVGKESSDFIAYCDSDDRWDPDHLSDSITYIRDKKYDLVYCNPKIVNSSGQLMHPANFSLFNEWDIENLKTKPNFIYISSVVHRNFGEYFDSTFDKIEDWELWVRLAEKGIQFIQKPKSTITYLVRQGGGGAAGSLIAHKLKEKYPVFLADFKPLPIKFNLGCGDEIIVGFINVDLYNKNADMQFDCAKIPVCYRD